MVENPKSGVEYRYRPSTGQPKRVRVDGFRGMTWIITTDTTTGRRRDVLRKYLEEL